MREFKIFMAVLFNIVVAILIVSFISLAGVVTLFFRKKSIKNVLLYLVSFAAGSLIGAVFFDLLPEALEEYPKNSELIMIYVVVGIVVFFVMEKLFYFYQHHHHHIHEREIKTFAYLNIIGDGIHNFLDGMVIAISFIADFWSGIVLTLAVIFHEIPQEIGDFGILVYGGFTKWKALLYNFFTALTALAGGILTYFITSSDGIKMFLLPLAAGNFLYLACSNLIPELHHEKKFKKSVMHIIAFLVGIIVMYVLTNMLPS